MKMTFLEHIFARLEHASSAPVLAEVCDGKIVSVTGGELLALIDHPATRAAVVAILTPAKQNSCCVMLSLLF